VSDINRLADLLSHIRQAAGEACVFVQGMDEVMFANDRRTQQAVIMSLIVIGEAASKVMDDFPDFAANHPEVPWRSMRGMRNRMAHGYFDINLTVVWETVRTALPTLLQQWPEPPRAAN
jgi:uncharacterized protein with HEPN domain